MPWYFYILDFVSGVFLANDVPHFTQGMSGHRFQTPFASPPGAGESSPLVNVLWGFANLAAGFVLLGLAWPGTSFGWVLFGLGALLIAVFSALHFGKVRGQS